MTLGDMLSHVGIGTKQLSERYAEYAQPSHDQHVYFGYEHAQPSPPHGHVAYSKHGHGGGHKSNAAMSALTLLAFLFFLHILQQCLRDHMAAMQQPQVMVMTGGRIGDENIAKRADIKKLDKSGNGNISPIHVKQFAHNEKENYNAFFDDEMYEDKYLTKITTADKAPKTETHKNKYSYKHYSNRSYVFPKMSSALDDYQ